MYKKVTGSDLPVLINLFATYERCALANGALGEMVQAMADIYGRYAGGPEW